ncbi:translation elongation factor 4 [Candidatus Azoamicus ciliaticola]|uniref:Elongation factor 4 n=1 Tax=Candidatus Azoamicus ciliaticola TaxID=2652803 RepID=A0A6J5JYL2_9GAMM|nr:translation elongation factor 4 [Candidatus Azoamicus ciliaticola]CAB3976433.1 Elongation factor 4 [Candidatus Azoamicus ciliaticola]
MKNIINFSIIAHINHGKSTLADRIIEITKELKINSLKNQSLDTMELERERGITIKSQCATLKYKINEKEYILNLIDTPGHTDFGYEVSRALAACECAILLIDVNQGIEAQTISNYKKAINEKISIIIALNKIDIAKVDIKKQKQNIINLLKIEEDDIIEISAKTGTGVKKLIEKLITYAYSTKENNEEKLQALIIDSWFNNYSGITCLIKIKNGKIKKDEKIITLSNLASYKITELGIFTPEKENKNELIAGEIGFVNINCKNPNNIIIGDTITSAINPSEIKLKKINKIHSRVYASIYPTESEDLENLKTSLSKLALNDSSLEYEIQKSSIFGIGFKCGFLGLLHLEIIQERLEREYELKIIITPPNVTYKITLKNNSEKYINNPSDMPDNNFIKDIYEPIALTTIITPLQYTKKVLELCKENRCEKINTTYLTDTVSIECELPLSEIIFIFFSKLQTLTNGFSSMDYTEIIYKKSDLVKINILLNDKKIDILEFITHKTTSLTVGKNLIEKLSKTIPKHLFDIKIQAAIDKKIIARTTIKGLKKNVIAKCYGGDISRKKKLIEKQKLGKKRMKKFGNIEIPQNAFFAMLDISKK